MRIFFDVLGAGLALMVSLAVGVVLGVSVWKFFLYLGWAQ